MNTEIAVETECCLLIFDPHQNHDWVRRILEKEDGRFTHLVLGGDYFDPSPGDSVADVREVCTDLLDWRERFGERLTVLLGNHDIAYFEAIRRRAEGGPLSSQRYRCSGHSEVRATVIAEMWDDAFWEDCRLFQCINGTLVSHAGVAGRFWNGDLPLHESLEALDADCREALNKVALELSPLLDAGYVRGGRSPVGGLTWLDFNQEFNDAEIGPGQIFGHTASREGKPRDRARHKGRSCCLDGHQTCYGRLLRDGRLEIGVA